MKEKTEYPVVLRAEHIAEILGIAKSTAYEKMRHADFPGRFVITGTSSARVSRERFFEYLENPSQHGEAG